MLLDAYQVHDRHRQVFVAGKVHFILLFHIFDLGDEFIEILDWAGVLCVHKELIIWLVNRKL